MASGTDTSGFSFEISLSVLNHLGRNLYRNFVTVLGEAISNSWDADATDVWIDIDRPNGRFVIKDDGIGMSGEDFQRRFLKIGYSKRKEGVTETDSGRPYIGAKGIGKLALLSCARRISIFTKTEGGDYVGGVIDNGGLDEAIKDDLKPDEYPLEKLDFSLIEGFTADHNSGTIIVFEGANEILTHSEEHIRKLLAMSFRFSIFDPDFNIIVNGAEVSINDLKALSDATEFIWIVNGYEDEFTKELSKLEAEPINVKTELAVQGFIATVRKPRDLKIAGTDDRATIDLFANGRLREKHVIRHIPTQRVPESYMYGQLHYDVLDQKGDDPFTSSREGILESDPDFQKLLEYLKGHLLRQIIEEDWDRLRLERGKEGDDENTRVSKKQRKAADLYGAAQEEFRLDEGAPGRDEVDRWFGELKPDAQFNITAYVDCFLSENLVRRFIDEKGKELVDPGKGEVAKFRKQEEKAKGKANISFDVRAQSDDLSFVGMDNLAWTAEGSKTTDGQQSLWADAINYNPVRNAVAHTALLTADAKDLLSLTLRNIKGRLKTLLSKLAE